MSQTDGFALVLSHGSVSSTEETKTRRQKGTQKENRDDSKEEASGEGEEIGIG
jgi:hypothetical protein